MLSRMLYYKLLAYLLLFGASLATFATSTYAQDIEVVEPPLIDQQPFDLLVLTTEAGGGEYKVLPLDFPNRRVPTNQRDSDKLEVVLVKFPERRYEIAWRNILRVELYEQRIYDEALEKMQSKDFIGAFQNLSFLMKNYPQMPKLEELRREFIFKSAADRFSAGQLTQTLSALEELSQTAPNFQPESVRRVLSRVASTIIDNYQKNNDVASAKLLLARLKRQYGPTLDVVREWDERLERQALERKEEAISLLGQERFREARAAAVDMLRIYPDLADGRELIEEINRRHPTVRVGVMQRSQELNPSSLVNWPAARTGRLVYRSLFQFLETGTEGGRYGFALGSPPRLSDDRKQLILSLDPTIKSDLDAFGLSQLLLDRANPESTAYDPSWAAIFQSVEAKPGANGGGQLFVNLKRPNVLPHALMQWTLAQDPERQDAILGDYALAALDGNEMSFELRPEVERRGQPVEIVEIFYSDPKDAVNDLLRGDIDAIDQLYPADAQRLRTNANLVVGSYALPTTHMLIPISDHPYLAKDKFRRALLYSTDRLGMLQGELLDSLNEDDGQLLSGPFPIGRGEVDPLAYAYNADIKPTAYNPQLARLLKVIVQNELNAAALKNGEPEPEMKKLIVACPDYEFARVAVQAMIQQWKIIDVEAEMMVLPTDRSFSKEDGYDLLYVTTTMWEPATDIERLLGGDGIAATDNPFIVQALERLRRAQNWREVRSVMQDMHQLVDYHLPVLPLWQITDRFVVSRYVEGIKDKPLSLYQDIDNWRVNLGFMQSSIKSR